MVKSYQNLTTVSLPPKDVPLFQEAAHHYQYRNIAAFFRTCGEMLVSHYKHGDKLLSPLAFEVLKKEKK